MNRALLSLAVLAGLAAPTAASAASQLNAMGVTVGGMVYPLPFPNQWPTLDSGGSAGTQGEKADWVINPGLKKLWYLDKQSRAGVVVEGMWASNFYQAGVGGEYGYGIVDKKYHAFVGAQATAGYAKFTDNGIYLWHGNGRLQVTGDYLLDKSSAVELTLWYGLLYPLYQKMGSDGTNVDGGDYATFGVELGYLMGDLKKGGGKKGGGKKGGGKKGGGKKK